jgi:hypothetical protein
MGVVTNRRLTDREIAGLLGDIIKANLNTDATGFELDKKYVVKLGFKVCLDEIHVYKTEIGKVKDDGDNNG